MDGWSILMTVKLILKYSILIRVYPVFFYVRNAVYYRELEEIMEGKYSDTSPRFQQFFISKMNYQ